MPASNDSIFATIESTLNTLQAEVLGYADDAITAAAGWYDPNITQEKYDSMPAWTPPSTAENKTPANLTGLANPRPTYTPPVWAIDPTTVANLLPTIEQQDIYRYTSELFDNFLEAYVRNIIADESYFADATVQEALFEKTRAKDLQALSDANDQAVRQFTAQRGFPVPNGILAGNLADLNKKYMDQVAARNNEVTSLIAERLHDARKHAMDTAVKMEDIRSRVMVAYNGYYMAIIDALVKKYQTEAQAEMEEVRNEIAQLQQANDITRLNAELGMHNDKLEQEVKIQRLLAQVEDIKMTVSMKQTELQQRVAASTSGAGSAAAIFSGASGMLTGINSKTEA